VTVVSDDGQMRSSAQLTTGPEPTAAAGAGAIVQSEAQPGNEASIQDDGILSARMHRGRAASRTVSAACSSQLLHDSTRHRSVMHRDNLDLRYIILTQRNVL